jgi:hypothetical protein
MDGGKVEIQSFCGQCMSGTNPEPNLVELRISKEEELVGKCPTCGLQEEQAGIALDLERNRKPH